VAAGLLALCLAATLGADTLVLAALMVPVGLGSAVAIAVYGALLANLGFLDGLRTSLLIAGLLLLATTPPASPCDPPHNTRGAAMTPWTSEELTRVGAAEELGIAFLRGDGTLGRPRTIWVVPYRDGPYIRSVNGPRTTPSRALSGAAGPPTRPAPPARALRSRWTERCAALFPRGRLGRACRPSAAPACHSR
jgi:Uncharacterized protein conserved in bacteria (DUF2255)